MKIPAPNHTQTPNDLFDHWLPLLKESELKVLLVIIRKTFGWHKQRDQISLSQLEQFTGLSESSVLSAIKSLVEKGVVSKITIGQIGKQQSFYELVFEDSNISYPPKSRGGPPQIMGDTPPNYGDTTRNSQKKSKNNKQEVVVVPSFIEEISDLSDSEKKALAKFPEERVKLALEFNKVEPPTTTKIQQLVWHCSANPPPKPKAKNRKVALYETMIEVQSKYQAKKSSLFVDKYQITFQPDGQGKPTVIKFSDSDAMEEIQKMMKLHKYTKSK